MPAALREFTTAIAEIYLMVPYIERKKYIKEIGNGIIRDFQYGLVHLFAFCAFTYNFLVINVYLQCIGRNLGSRLHVLLLSTSSGFLAAA